MSKKIFAVVILVMMLFVMGCEPSDNGGGSINNGGNQDGGSTGGKGVEEKNENGEFIFTGKVISVSDPYHIEMEIIGSEIAFGIYWVNVSSQTEYVGADSVPINREDIKVGDVIEVVFSGQVMMSYPPRISAQKIIVK